MRRAFGEAALDPDEQVQRVVRLVFGKFAELGRCTGVLRWLVDHGIQLGIRLRSGPDTGELVWRRPNRMTLQCMLHNPVYAGIDAYGRRRVDPRRQVPGRPSTGRVVRADAEWLVLLPGRLPAYISVEQDHANLARLAANTARAETPRGRPGRVGAAVGPGALRPLRPTHDGALPPARADDPARVRLRPAGDRLRRRPALPGAGRRVRRRAGHRAGLGRTRPGRAGGVPACRAAGPGRAGRAGTGLGPAPGTRRDRRRPGPALLPPGRAGEPPGHPPAGGRLGSRARRPAAPTRGLRPVLSHPPPAAHPAQQQAIAALAGDIPALWAAPTTTDLDRKPRIRALVEQVTITLQGRSERVAVTITWAGGHTTTGQTVRPVARLDQLSAYPQLLRRVRELAEDGHRAHAITRRLHAEGFHPAKGRDRIGVTAISQLLRELGYPPSSDRARPAPPPGQAPGPDEWWLDDLATELGMPPITLHSWLRRGWVHGRKETTPPHRWILHADQHELAELRQRRTRPPGWYTQRRWADPTPPTRNHQGQAASSHLSVHRG